MSLVDRMPEAVAWEVLDTMSDEHLAALEALYPTRCIKPDETFDDHLRYAGKVELVAGLVSRRQANPRKIVVDASDPKSIEGLASADVPSLSSEPASPAAGPAASPSSSSAPTATARALEARRNQTARRAGQRPGQGR